MSQDLLSQIRASLEKRKGEWKSIAAAIPGVSYSWLSQVGRGTYRSAPTYARLKTVSDFLNRRSKVGS